MSENLKDSFDKTLKPIIETEALEIVRILQEITCEKWEPGISVNTGNPCAQAVMSSRKWNAIADAFQDLQEECAIHDIGGCMVREFESGIRLYLMSSGAFNYIKIETKTPDPLIDRQDDLTISYRTNLMGITRDARKAPGFNPPIK